MSSNNLRAPALSWNAMLNMKKIGLELISDADMYFVFEKDMSGGVFYISERYSKANNNYLTFYDPKQQSKHIIYLDTNNSYGHALFKFFSNKRIQMDRL